MLNGTTVFAAAIGYVLLLFALAYWGDHSGRAFLVGRRRTLVYALSLAVYCTSWTYYGSVGLASAHGLDFLTMKAKLERWKKRRPAMATHSTLARIRQPLHKQPLSSSKAVSTP